MKLEESRAAIKLLGGLFPGQVTQEQAKMLAKQFMVFAPASVNKAIQAHRAERTYFDFPQLLTGIRAAERSQSGASVTNHKDTTWAEVYRRQSPCLYGAGDFEVILRVHRDWWIRSPQTEGSKRQLSASCASALASAEMGASVIPNWVEAVFHPEPAYFRQCLEELRTSIVPTAA